MKVENLDAKVDRLEAKVDRLEAKVDRVIGILLEVDDGKESGIAQGSGSSGGVPRCRNESLIPSRMSLRRSSLALRIETGTISKARNAPSLQPERGTALSVGNRVYGSQSNGVRDNPVKLMQQPGPPSSRRSDWRVGAQRKAIKAFAPFTVQGHSRPFQSSADQCAAASFDHSGSDKEVLAAKLGVAHTFGVALEVVGFQAHRLVLFGRAGGSVAKRADKVLDTPLIELLLAPHDPAPALLAVEREEDAAQVPQLSGHG